jgi:cytochrome c-type biogenesis protein CcmH/NrfG
MGSVGKKVIVYTMMWVLLVMVLLQVYDNVTGRGMPVKKDTQAAGAGPTVAPDEGVARLAALQTCVASDPKNLQCTLDLANLYYQAGLWGQAQITYESAIKLDPHDVATLLKLAGTYIYQAKFEQAIPTLRDAAALKPDSPEIHLLLGLALSKLSPPHMDAAVSEWRQVVSLDPSSAWASQASQYIAEAGR